MAQLTIPDVVLHQIELAARRSKKTSKQLILECIQDAINRSNRRHEPELMPRAAAKNTKSRIHQVKSPRVFKDKEDKSASTDAWIIRLYGAGFELTEIASWCHVDVEYILRLLRK